MVTAVGEVPPETVREIANSVAPLEGGTPAASAAATPVDR